jgi:hypothetical protein
MRNFLFLSLLLASAAYQPLSMLRSLLKTSSIRPFTRAFGQTTVISNGNQVDVTKQLSFADLKHIELPTNEKSETLLKIRHSTAHVMAMAVQKLFPNIKVTIGPWIDNG